jgi:hypothetical protein
VGRCTKAAHLRCAKAMPSARCAGMGRNEIEEISTPPARLPIRPPDECPICNRGIEPAQINAISHEVTMGKVLQVVFRCPRQNCRSLFIATYETSSDIRRVDRGFFLVRVEPRRFQKKEFRKHVSQTSPLFVEIFNEALAAEALGFKHIAGMGLRKALEFLVKDFCKSQRPEEKEQIESASLGPCIDRFVDDSRVKECAKRATWLGNDETHYLRVWADATIEDLKVLIDLTVNWVESVLLTAEFKKRMPEKPKKTR